MTGALARRIAFTLGALLVYRFGRQLPLPGIDPRAWAQMFPASRIAIFALGIYPYVSAALLVQLVMFVSRRLRALERRDERGRRTIVRATIYLTLLMTSLQAWGVAHGLKGIGGAADSPGAMFFVTTATTLTAGTMFLIWLSEQITRQGIGNGLAIILFADIVTGLPSAIAATLELDRQGAFSAKELAALLALVVCTSALIVWVELARRKIPIQFPSSQADSDKLEVPVSYLSIKINSAGIIPALVASTVLGWLAAFSSFSGAINSSWPAQLNHGRFGFLLIYAVLIVVCAFVYTAFAVDPETAAQRLEKFGAVVPGIEPGEPTAAAIDNVVSRVTLIGAIYLTFVCLLPEILISRAAVPFYFGSTALLIAVCTMLDVLAQIRAQWRRTDAVGDDAD